MRYLRIVLAILIGFSLLSLGLVASLYFIITPESVQTRLSNTLSSHFGVVLEPTAEFELHRLPSMRITIPKSAVRLNTSQTATGTLESAVISMSPFAYFAKKPRIEDISITGLSLKLSEDDVNAFLKPRPNATADIISIETLTSTATSIHVLDGDRLSLRIDNAQFGMRDITETGAGVAAKFLLQTTDFTGNAELAGIFDWAEGPINANARNVTLSARGLWRGTDLTGELSVARLGNPFADQFSLDDLDATAQLANGYAARFAAPVLTSADGRITADGARTSLMVPGQQGSDIYLMHGKIDYNKKEKALNAQGLKIETSTLADGEKTPLPNGSVSGDVKWNFAQGEGRVLLEGMFRSTPLKIDTTIRHPKAIVPAVSPLPAPRSEVPAEPALEADAQAAVVTAADNIAPQPSPVEEVPVSDAAPVLSTEESPVVPIVAPRPTVEGEVTVGRLSADRLAQLLSGQSDRLSGFDWKLRFAIGTENAPLGIHRFEGDFLVNDGRARIEHGSVILKTVVLPYTAEIAPDGFWKAEANWHDIESSTFFATPVLTGLSDGVLSANGNATELAKTRVSLALTVRNGELTGTDLTKVHEIMLRERPEKMPREAFRTEARTPFDLFNVNARFENGLWTIENTAAEGPLWKADFAGKSYANMLTLSVGIDFLKQNGEHAFSMPAVVTVRTNESPVWNPDWERARTDANAKLGEVAWSFGLLKNKIEREFDNWWETREWPSFDFDLNPSEWLPDFEWPEITYPEWVPDWVPRPDQKDDTAPALPI